jgi:hypothetical protein
MAVLIRTSDVPPAHRHDAWRSIVGNTLGPLDFRSDPDVPLWGEIEAGRLGPVNVGRVQTSTPHSVHRTPGLIRRRVLDGQTHNVSPTALAPELLEFFNT